MYDKPFFEKYINRKITLNTPVTERAFWISGTVTEVHESFLIFCYSQGKWAGSCRTIPYADIKAVEFPKEAE